MSALLDLGQIILIDLSLAADNALVVGLAVAALPVKRRKRAMAAGIAGATILRVLMALFAVQLLHITGLLVAGGVLLAWVAWKMFREIRSMKHKDVAPKAAPAAKKFSSAVWQIIVADISMSLDNVLAVAGVARDDVPMLVAGLGLSIALMALASTYIAKVAAKYHWAAYIGVAIVFYTAVRMMIDGAEKLGWLNSIHAFA
ncbi:MAG: YjbE family putative metal transport protein [Alphaproteobacteria bacterium]|nr:YjbE family putative metal transport protein [Alphaproteobacteria bacterium]